MFVKLFSVLVVLALQSPPLTLITLSLSLHLNQPPHLFLLDPLRQLFLLPLFSLQLQVQSIVEHQSHVVEEQRVDVGPAQSPAPVRATAVSQRAAVDDLRHVDRFERPQTKRHVTARLHHNRNHAPKHVPAAISTLRRFVHFRNTRQKVRKGKKEYLYSAFLAKVVHSKRSGMDHTVLPANNTMPAFPS